MKKTLFLLQLLILFACSHIHGQAILPLFRTSWDSTPTGWTDGSLNSYLSTFACSGSNGAKFDTTGDTKSVFFNSAPTTLTFTVKSPAATTSSSLLVQESSDGVNYSTLINTASLPGFCQVLGPTNLLSTTRYVKWTFTRGSSASGGQNMTMDDVSISNVALGTSDFESLNDKLNIFSVNNSINFLSKVEKIEKIEIYNLLGQKILNKNNINQLDYIVENLDLNSEIIVGVVTLENGQYLSKKIFYSK